MIIKRTAIERGTVITHQRAQPHLLRPFETFVLDEDTNVHSRTECFCSLAAALQYHVRIVAALKVAT